MRSSLPQDWKTMTLGDVCSKPQYGWTSRAVKIGRIKYIRTTDISTGKIDWSTVPYCEKDPHDIEKYRIRPNDLLVSRAGSVGVSLRISDVPCDAVFASYLIRFKPLDSVQSKYVEFFLKSDAYWRAITEFTAGIAIPNVNASKLASLKLPLAPLPEQRRIVAKLETLLAKLDACQQRLAKIPTLLKRFRQSILASACSGRLTADWRDRNPHVEAALAVKGRYKMAALKGVLHDLPVKWEWVAMGNYGHCSRGRFSIRPRNDPKYFDGPYPFIQIGDLPPDGGCITSHRQTLNERGLGVSKKFEKGTVVIAIVGATIGNTGLLSYDTCFTDSMVGIETGTEVGNRYVELFLRQKKHEIRQASYSSGGQPNIKLEFLNPFPVALPPLAEQQEIVRRVESLFTLADQIEARCVSTETHVDNLVQSILAKAFRGELVRQDLYHALTGALSKK